MTRCNNSFPSLLQCVYWYVSPTSGYGKWSARGCRVESIGVNFVNCSCDHLSLFAVLTEDSFALARTQISYGQELGSSVSLMFSIGERIVVDLFNFKPPGHKSCGIDLPEEDAFPGKILIATVTFLNITSTFSAIDHNRWAPHRFDGS